MSFENMIRKPKFSFCLIHPTRKNVEEAINTRNLFTERAFKPDAIQHIFCYDENEPKINVKKLKEAQEEHPNFSLVRACDYAKTGGNAVANWNAGSTYSRAYLTFAIADDLEPPDEWDKQIWTKIGYAYNGYYVISIDDSSDSWEKDTPYETKLLPRHPLLTWKWLNNHRCIFSPLYNGVYCDNDLMLKAIYENAFMDLTDVKFLHKAQVLLHPKDKLTGNSKIMNSNEAYKVGKEIFKEQEQVFKEKYHYNPYELK